MIGVIVDVDEVLLGRVGCLTWHLAVQGTDINIGYWIHVVKWTWLRDSRSDPIISQIGNQNEHDAGVQSEI